MRKSRLLVAGLVVGLAGYVGLKGGQLCKQGPAHPW